CSSSLVALHLASRSIRSGECELALAGGVTVMATPEMFVEFSRQRGLSPDGRCRSFGAGADGTGWSEGLGVLVLERLSRAREQGHTVLAVIAGSAVNQDGASNGLTAPHGPAQQRVIRAALASAGLDVGDIDVVEGHGTATRLGDPIEIDALLATYGQRGRAGDPVWLGSVKSNVGHTQAAAGVAGVIKMVQAMRHGVLPMSLYCEEPSRHVDWASGHVRLLDRAREWCTPEGRPRRAGISSFGISGTNAHLVLEQAPADSTPDRAGARTDPGPVAWVLSARSAPALAAQAARLHRFVTATDAVADDADIGWSLTLRSRFDQRAVVVGRNRAQLAAGLLRLAEGQPAGLGSPVVGRTVPGRLVWVFTGQGSQRTGMGQRLRTVFLAFASAWDEVVEALDVLLADVLREAHANSLNDVVAAPDSLLESTSFAQPALFAFQVALARLWQSWGIRPDYLMGHSVGEIAAAHIAGVLSLSDAATVVAARARSMGRLPAGGAMVSIAATEQQVAQVLAEVGAGAAVDIAAVNGPRAVVVSGAGDAVDAVAHALAACGFRTRRLRVSHAFHSALMDPALDEFAAAVAGIRTRPATVPVISNLTGEPIADTHDHGDGFGSAAYWTRHIRRPVRFRDGVAAARRAGAVVFAEIGPAAALSGAILETCSATSTQEPLPPVVVTATAARDDTEDLAVLTAAARGWSTGVPVEWQALYPASARRVALPTYAFQRSRYWPTKPGEDATGLGLEPTGHALLGAMTSTSAGQWIWTGGVGVPTHPWLADHVVAERILFPGTAFVELAVAAARRAGAGILRELTLVRPLILTAHESVHLQLVLDPPRTEHGETTRRLAVFSRPRDRSHGDGEPWTKHAEGVLGDQRAEPGADMVADRPPPSEQLDPATAYAELAERGYRYGPVFRGLRAVWRSGVDVLVEAALPEGTATDGFLLHPALLDALLHGWLLTRAETGDTPVPFEWTGVYLAAAECRSVRARIRDLGGNRLALTVVTPDGVLVASADAVMFRDTGAAFGAGEAGEGNLLHRIDWPEIAAPAAPMPSVTVVSGVEDLDRAEATAELVLVDRRRGGVEPDAVRAAVHDLLRLLVRWSSDRRFERSRLAVITCGAVDVDGAGVTDLAGAAVWGLIRSAGAELPDRILLVDVDRPDGDLAQIGGAGEFAGVEPAVAVRGGRLRAPRLLPFDGRPLVPEAADWVFGLAERGTVDGLVAVPRTRRPQDLAPDEVLIDVEAIGLNFRDALIALGLYPDPDATVGSEAAGIVVAVGAAVPELSAGDRVTGIFAGPVGSSAVADHRYLVRIPKSLGAEQAAAVPVAFATACYGLCDLAGVRPGEAVLIHAAAGGVGQAAVQVARRLGAEVFATASPGKWNVLRAMGIPDDRIADSRDFDFADRFLAATGGRGVDAVLNSLAGESVDASLRLLPRGGTFLEMGKTDVRDAAELERRHPGVRYRPYDLFDAGPDRIRRILAGVVDDIAAGALTPPAVTRWSLPRIRDALRHLGQGRSIGKNVVTPAIPRDGTILITGGTGALGAVIARHLVRAHGVRTLILTGRRGAAAPGAADLITDLREHGADVTVRACDIADRNAVAELLAAVPAAAPLRGIVHAAGVSDDATVANLTAAQLDSVLRPKVDGAWQLHERTRALDLPLFVVFSSIAGIAGTAGQANYAAANAFLDALVSYRRERGLAATSIAWGPWDGAGMAARLRPADLARLERLGLRPLPADLAVRLFDLALGADTVLTAARWHRSGPARLLRSRPLPDRVSMPTTEQEDAVASASTLAARVRSAAPDRRTTVALYAVREEAAHVLGHASGRAIEPEQPLGELGFDSLAAVEFRNRLATLTGLPLPTGLIYDHPTALALARYLVAALTDDETESDEASIRRILGDIPISTLRDSGLLPALLRLAGRTGAQDPPPASDDIDAMDVAGLVELALESDIEGTK
ncbi:type I polyketide synthase, partial [Nocardia africana]